MNDSPYQECLLPQSGVPASAVRISPYQECLLPQQSQLHPALAQVGAGPPSGPPPSPAAPPLGKRHQQLGKWLAYYQRGELPWDTGLPASQLVHYLTACPTTLSRQSYSPGDPVQEVQLPEGSYSPGSSPGPPPACYHICAACCALKPPAGCKALELACGTGASCVFMARCGFQVAGVDCAPAAVEAARRCSPSQAAAISAAAVPCFVEHDVFTLPQPFTLAKARALQETTYPAAAAASAAGGGSSRPHTEQAGPGQDADADDAAAFDFVYDCQAFHALRQVNEAAYVSLLYTSLKPGGLLLLLAGNANEAAAAAAGPGPAVLSEGDLAAAFPAERWQRLWLLQTRFDGTPCYRAQGRLPLAWWALMRKRGGGGKGEQEGEGRGGGPGQGAPLLSWLHLPPLEVGGIIG